MYVSNKLERMGKEEAIHFGMTVEGLKKNTTSLRQHTWFRCRYLNLGLPEWEV
jgi:hypothetical protein